jgi:hypothetical protein
LRVDKKSWKVGELESWRVGELESWREKTVGDKVTGFRYPGERKSGRNGRVARGEGQEN